MRKKYWYGKEIEGRLYGMETLFVSDDFEGFEKIAEKFNHILIGPTLISKMSGTNTQQKITWDIIEKMIDEDKKMFTLEAKPENIKEIPKSMILKCHILLWIDVPELAELKSSDSIKVCPRSHEMYCFTLYNGQKVNRQDYIHDRHDI